MRPLSKGMYAQPSGYAIYEPCVKSPTLSQMFVMATNGVVMTDESVCLDAPERDTRHEKPKVKIMACNGLQRQKWRYDQDVSKFRIKTTVAQSTGIVIKYNELHGFCFFQTKAFVHVSSGMCLHVATDTEEGPVIASCNNNAEQQWIMEKVPWK